MANHEEEEEERKSGRRGGPEEEKEGLRSEKHKRHEEEQKSMMKDWDSTKIVYLCFGLYGRDHPVVYCSIEPLEFSSSGVWRMGQYPVGTTLTGMGIGAYGSKIVFAGGQESIFEGYKYRSCPSKGMRIIDTEDPNRIVDPSYVFNSSTFQRGKCCPLVAQYDCRLYVLSTLCLKTWAGKPFSGGFEMFDPKVGKWVTLPECPTFRYIGLSRGTSSVVVGSNIFVSISGRPIFRFDMADPNHQWEQHIFTDYPEFSLPLGRQTLAVETRDGDWVLFTCKLEVHPVADDKDYPKDDDYCDVFDEFDLLLEWKDTSMIVYLMSKDLTSLKALEPLKLPHLNAVPICARNIQPMLVHLGAQTVGLILSTDIGDESMRKKEIFSMMFEFEIEDNIRSLALRNFCGPFKCTSHVNETSEQSATRVGLLNAIVL
ncbi:hypothetical protein ACE6H2_018984 [Prunus campanulata]